MSDDTAEATSSTAPDVGGPSEASQHHVEDGSACDEVPPYEEVHIVGDPASGSEAPPGSAPLTTSDLFELLANHRRRLVIRRLLRESPVTVGDLAVHIAAVEHDCAEEAVESRWRKTAYVSLIQSHLPKLDDAGVVTYDSTAKQVTAAPRLAVFEPFLGMVDASDGSEAAAGSWWSWKRVAGVVAVLACLTVVGGLVASGSVPPAWLWPVPVGEVPWLSYVLVVRRSID